MSNGNIMGVIVSLIVCVLAVMTLGVTVVKVIRAPRRNRPPREPWRLTTKIGCMSAYFAGWFVVVIMPWHYYSQSEARGWCAIYSGILGLMVGGIIVAYWVVAGLIRWFRRPKDIA